VILSADDFVDGPYATSPVEQQLRFSRNQQIFSVISKQRSGEWRVQQFNVQTGRLASGTMRDITERKAYGVYCPEKCSDPEGWEGIRYGVSASLPAAQPATYASREPANIRIKIEHSLRRTRDVMSAKLLAMAPVLTSASGFTNSQGYWLKEDVQLVDYKCPNLVIYAFGNQALFRTPTEQRAGSFRLETQPLRIVRSPDGDFKNKGVSSQAAVAAEAARFKADLAEMQQIVGRIADFNSAANQRVLQSMRGAPREYWSAAGRTNASFILDLLSKVSSSAR
jgi:hypothetical protein